VPIDASPPIIGRSSRDRRDVAFHVKQRQAEASQPGFRESADAHFRR
jgi:hypothetical protein